MKFGDNLRDTIEKEYLDLNLFVNTLCNLGVLVVPEFINSEYYINNKIFN